MHPVHRIWISWALAASSVVLGGCHRDQSALVLRLAHATPPHAVIARSAEEFARRANARLGARAKVVVFGAGQLGGDEVVLNKLKLGTVQLAVPSTVMSSAVDAFALFEMPYLIRDRAHMRRIEEQMFWTELAPRAEAQGFKILAVWENGFRHVTNNIRPIMTPKDLTGIKIRTPRSPWRIRVFQAFGASPAPLPFSEVFMALQTGVMDGQENPLANIHGAALHEVQSYLSLTGHVYSPAYLTVGAAPWAELPEEVRTIVEETARGIRDYAYALAAATDAELIRELTAAGMLVNEPDRSQFRAASAALYDEFATTVDGGRALIDAVISLVEQ